MIFPHFSIARYLRSPRRALRFASLDAKHANFITSPRARGHRMRDKQWIHAERTLNKHISGHRREPRARSRDRVAFNAPTSERTPISGRAAWRVRFFYRRHAERREKPHHPPLPSPRPRFHPPFSLLRARGRSLGPHSFCHRGNNLGRARARHNFSADRINGA